MSIKLSIKDLKDLLKINKQAIKKRRRKRNKRLIKNSNDVNYNKSSSDHMKSIGFTNTSNEATELIRLQRQALEDKLKNDKEDRIKSDDSNAVVPYNPLQNTGGSSDLRRDYINLHKTVNYMMMGMDGREIIMPAHGKAMQQPINNVGFIDDGPTIEEVDTSKGAVFPSSGGDDEETVDFTQKETTTTPTPKKQKSAMKNFIGMFTPTPKEEEEKQAEENPSKTLPESTKKIKKDVTIKDAAVGESEQMFDPDSLDIDKSTRIQLIGFINYKRGVTDNKLLYKLKPDLLVLAKSIKKEEAEADKAKKKQPKQPKKASGVVI